MKKIAVALLVLVLFASLTGIIACASQPTPSPSPTPTAQPTTTSVPSPSPTPTAKPEGIIPQVITLKSNDIGSSQYTMDSLVANAIMEKYKMKFRLIPQGGEIASMVLLHSGEINIASFGGGILPVNEGIYDFAERSWGPQSIRVIRAPRHPGYLPAVRADSNIYTLADLKGKRVPHAAGATGLNTAVEAVLAFANLTFNDVKKAETSGPLAGSRAPMDGLSDLGFVNPSASFAYEWAAAPYGLRYLQMPLSDKEGWARAQKAGPQYLAGIATKGPGISSEKPVEGFTFGYPVWAGLDKLPENTAYFIAKAVHETYDRYAAQDEWVKNTWTIETHWEIWEQMGIPLHDGAIRYYKEIGQWTTERETIQKATIEYQNRLKALWKAAFEESLDKQVKEKDFPAFWMEKRAEAGLS